MGAGRPVELEIIYKEIDDLIPYNQNPRNTQKGLEYLVSAIREVGFINPVVLWKNNEIAAGHKRLQAAQIIGLKRIPTISAEHLTEQQIKAYRLIDNKVSEFFEWDDDLLQVELSELNEFDMSDFGFGNADDFDMSSTSQEKELRPYSFAHILITFPISKIEKIAEVIEYCEKNGYDYEQSNN